MENLVVISLEDLKTVIRDILKSNNTVVSTETPKILDVSEAASFLKISASSLYAYTSQRKIPFFKRGKRLYFKSEDLVAWINEGQRDSISSILNKI